MKSQQPAFTVIEPNHNNSESTTTSTSTTSGTPPVPIPRPRNNSGSSSAGASTGIGSTSETAGSVSPPPHALSGFGTSPLHCPSFNNHTVYVTSHPPNGNGNGNDNFVRGRSDSATSTVSNSAVLFDPELISNALSKFDFMKGIPTGDCDVWDCENKRMLKDFGTCSYLGLNTFPPMVEAAREALSKHGLYTNASRIWLEFPMLGEMEAVISQKMGGYFIMTPKVHTASILFANTVVGKRDVLILDREVHTSVHNATDTAKAKGVRKVVVPHHDLESALKQIRKAENEGVDRIWYCSDGLHSMHGTLLDVELVKKLLAASPKVHLYIDDAHGSGWTGEGGRGVWLRTFPMNERMIVAISLCKAVSCGGGGLLFGNKADWARTRVQGTADKVTAPLPPSVLASIKAFFEWIDTPDGKARQKHLEALIERFNERMKQAPCIPVHNYEVLPIKSIHVGTLDRALALTKGVRDDGFYVCYCSFPFIPRGHAALRITFNAALKLEDVDRLCDSLVRHCGTDLPGFETRVYDPNFDAEPAVAAVASAAAKKKNGNGNGNKQ